MVELGVRRRSYSEAMALMSKTNWVTRGALEDLYWEKSLSPSQVGLKLGLSRTVVLGLMKKLSIPRRTTSQAGVKFPKRPFAGDENEASYLLGFRIGDLHAEIDGHQVRFST